MPKTWEQKYHNGRMPEITKTDKAFGGIPAYTDFLISTPEEIDRYIREIPPGEKRTTDDLKHDIALRHGVNFMCPLTAGIFLRIVAERAYEKLQAGEPKASVCPFWRVISSSLAKKLSFGPEELMRLQQEEEHSRA